MHIIKEDRGFRAPGYFEVYWNRWGVAFDVIYSGGDEDKWPWMLHIHFLLLNIFLLIVGCMLDIFSALVLVLPLILPIAKGYGIDPIHLGIIFLTNLQIGYNSPPLGLDLFLASYRFERPITELYRASLPFLAVLYLTLAIITYVPWLSLIFVHLWG